MRRDFDELIREKLQGVEIEFQASDWDFMESQLDEAGIGKKVLWYNNWRSYMVAAAAVLIPVMFLAVSQINKGTQDGFAETPVTPTEVEGNVENNNGIAADDNVDSLIENLTGTSDQGESGVSVIVEEEAPVTSTNPVDQIPRNYRSDDEEEEESGVKVESVTPTDTNKAKEEGEVKKAPSGKKSSKENCEDGAFIMPDALHQMMFQRDFTKPQIELTDQSFQLSIGTNLKSNTLQHEEFSLNTKRVLP